MTSKHTLLLTREYEMLGKEHLIFGISTSVAFALAFQNQADLLSEVCFVGTAALGSIIPDVDLETSAIGRKLKPISFIISHICEHRTYTHDPALWIPLAIFLTIKYSFLFGFFFGYLGHILLDSFTAGGIPFFYLVNKKKIHTLPYSMKFSSDSLAAKVVTLLMSATGVAVIHFVSKI